VSRRGPIRQVFRARIDHIGAGVRPVIPAWRTPCNTRLEPVSLCMSEARTWRNRSSGRPWTRRWRCRVTPAWRASCGRWSPMGWAEQRGMRAVTWAG